MTDCCTCVLPELRDSGTAPPRDNILRTAHWDVVHAFGTTVEGWIVLVLRRHVSAISDLDDDEAATLGPIVVRVSRALEEVTGCVRTYMALFAEDPAHRHVHVHVVPRFADQPEDARGPQVFSQLGRPDHEAVAPARMDELALELRQLLTA